MIELKNITKTYSVGKDGEFRALDEVSLIIEKGDFVAIQGASGSGKSTLLNIIGLLDDYSQGQYLLAGQDVSGLKDGKRATLRNQHIGFVLQDFALLNSQTVYYNVMLPLLLGNTPYGQIKQKVMKALKAVGVEGQAKKKANQLSGGQRQRVAIARAMVTEPQVILADEPTGQLDSKTGQAIMEIFRELNDRGITIVMVTHDDKVAGYARRRILLSDGKVVE